MYQLDGGQAPVTMLSEEKHVAQRTRSFADAQDDKGDVDDKRDEDGSGNVDDKRELNIFVFR